MSKFIKIVEGRHLVKMGGVDHGFDKEELFHLYEELSSIFSKKIKIHSMSEEPEINRGDFVLLFNSRPNRIHTQKMIPVFKCYDTDDNTGIVNIYYVDKSLSFSWNELKNDPLIANDGWVYPCDLYQLIKDNTAL